ncbi:glycoside hydrolase family protein, partial [Salmonella enterica]
MLDDTRKMAIVNMTFQMGVGGVANFNTMLGYLALGQYDNAADAALDSLWARQTPSRARRVSEVMRNGNLVPYGGSQGSAPSLQTMRMFKAASVSSTAQAPSFTEPESPYSAVYPYNKVYESESGHI